MKKLNTITFALLLVAALSCSGNKKNKTTDTAEAFLSVSGTYEAVVPSTLANASAAYTLIALSDKGEYELYRKVVGDANSHLSKGNFEVQGDSVKLLHNPETELFIVKNDQLVLGETIFQKISAGGALESEYKLFSIKENKSGEIVQVTLYTKEAEGYAEFEFNGNAYKLKEDAESTQERLFTDGSTLLVWNIVDPAPLADYQPLLKIGSAEHTFTLVSPINRHFVAKEGESTPNSYDVLYFNLTPGKSFVKLLSETASITLPQTEASAKTAEYAQDGISWSISNKNVATLTVNGRSSDYLEVGK